MKLKNILNKKKLKLLTFRNLVICLFQLFIISSFILLVACKKDYGEFEVGAGNDSVDGFFLTEFEMKGVRFVPEGFSSSIKPARTYWLKRGNVIAPKWSNLEFHWEKEGEMCNFSNGTVNQNCQICDYCNPPADFDDPPCMGFSGPFFARNALKIVVDSGFIKTENPTTVFGYDRSTSGNTTTAIDTFLGTCVTTPNSSTPFIEPENSGLYRFAVKSFNIKLSGETDSEIKLHIIETGESLAQTTAYQLTPQRIDGTDFWAWAIQGDSLWLENFSPNLRVTDIRIFRGICGDGSMQGKQCAVPNEKIPVKVSSLRFLPDFQGTVSGHQQEAQHHCYSHTLTTGDSFLDFDQCLETPTSQLTAKSVTPTYEFNPSNPNKKLTWIAEFNTALGADADLETPGNQALPADANLIIEFTIEAN